MEEPADDPTSAGSGPNRRYRWYFSRIGRSLRYRLAFIFSWVRNIAEGLPVSECSRPFVW
jgi:hypothetical protein